MASRVDPQEHDRRLQPLCFLVAGNPQPGRPDLGVVPLVSLNGKVVHIDHHFLLLFQRSSILSQRHANVAGLVALTSQKGQSVVEPLQLQQQLNVKGRIDVIVEGYSIELRRDGYVGCGLSCPKRKENTADERRDQNIEDVIQFLSSIISYHCYHLCRHQLHLCHQLSILSSSIAFPLTMRLDPLPVAGIRLQRKEVLDIILTANAAAFHSGKSRRRGRLK